MPCTYSDASSWVGHAARKVQGPRSCALWPFRFPQGCTDAALGFVQSRMPNFSTSRAVRNSVGRSSVKKLILDSALRMCTTLLTDIMSFTWHGSGECRRYWQNCKVSCPQKGKPDNQSMLLPKGCYHGMFQLVVGIVTRHDRSSCRLPTPRHCYCAVQHIQVVCILVGMCCDPQLMRVPSVDCGIV
jgi:hypothetical protein